MKEKAPLVSLIIGNYNGAAILGECLESVLSQTHADREVIVVDDASTDDSLRVIRDYSGVKLLANRKNSGLAVCRNRGLEQARGRFIAFLDNDVVLAPDWLERMLEAVDRWPRARIFASHLVFYDWPDRIDSTGGCMNLAGYAWGRSVNRRVRDVRDSPHVFYPCGAAMFMYRELLERVGGFDPAYYYSYDDVELGWSAHMMGWQVIYVREAMAKHRCSYAMGAYNPRKLYLYERSRLRSLLKNLEGTLLRAVAAEVAFLLLQRLSQELLAVRHEWKDRLRYAGCLARAVLWNLIHLPSTLRMRRRVARRRRVSDLDLIKAGLILPRIESHAAVSDAPGQHLSACAIGGTADVGGEGFSLAGEGLTLGSGWHRPESSGSGESFRWTEDEAEAVFACNGDRRRLVIETMMAHPRGESRVEVEANGLPLGEFRAGNGPAAHVFELAGLEVNGSLRLRLRIANPFVPAELLSSPDQRLLGVAVTRISLE